MKLLPSSLTTETITDEIIADCIRMAKSKTFCTSIGVTNLAKNVLPDRIANDERFWGAMVKVKTEQLDINVNEYFESLRLG